MSSVSRQARPANAATSEKATPFLSAKHLPEAMSLTNTPGKVCSSDVSAAEDAERRSSASRISPISPSRISSEAYTSSHRTGSRQRSSSSEAQAGVTPGVVHGIDSMGTARYGKDLPAELSTSTAKLRIQKPSEPLAVKLLAPPPALPERPALPPPPHASKEPNTQSARASGVKSDSDAAASALSPFDPLHRDFAKPPSDLLSLRTPSTLPQESHTPPRGQSPATHSARAGAPKVARNLGQRDLSSVARSNAHLSVLADLVDKKMFSEEDVLLELEAVRKRSLLTSVPFNKRLLPILAWYLLRDKFGDEAATRYVSLLTSPAGTTPPDGAVSTTSTIASFLPRVNEIRRVRREIKESNRKKPKHHYAINPPASPTEAAKLSDIEGAHDKRRQLRRTAAFDALEDASDIPTTGLLSPQSRHTLSSPCVRNRSPLTYGRLHVYTREDAVIDRRDAKAEDRPVVDVVVDAANRQDRAKNVFEVVEEQASSVVEEPSVFQGPGRKPPTTKGTASKSMSKERVPAPPASAHAACALGEATARSRHGLQVHGSDACAMLDVTPSIGVFSEVSPANESEEGLSLFYREFVGGADQERTPSVSAFWKAITSSDTPAARTEPGRRCLPARHPQHGHVDRSGGPADYGASAQPSGLAGETVNSSDLSAVADNTTSARSVVEYLHGVSGDHEWYDGEATAVPEENPASQTLASTVAYSALNDPHESSVGVGDTENTTGAVYCLATSFLLRDGCAAEATDTSKQQPEQRLYAGLSSAESPTIHTVMATEYYSTLPNASTTTHRPECSQRSRSEASWETSSATMPSMTETFQEEGAAGRKTGYGSLIKSHIDTAAMSNADSIKAREGTGTGLHTVAEYSAFTDSGALAIGPCDASDVQSPTISKNGTLRRGTSAATAAPFSVLEASSDTTDRTRQSAHRVRGTATVLKSPLLDSGVHSSRSEGRKTPFSDLPATESLHDGTPAYSMCDGCTGTPANRPLEASSTPTLKPQLWVVEIIGKGSRLNCSTPSPSATHPPTHTAHYNATTVPTQALVVLLATPVGLMLSSTLRMAVHSLPLPFTIPHRGLQPLPLQALALSRPITASLLVELQPGAAYQMHWQLISETHAGTHHDSVRSRGGYGSMMEADSAVAPDAGAASRSNGGYSLGGRSETSVQSRGGYGSMMEADSAVAPDASAASRSNGGYSLGGRSETSVQSRGGYGSMMEADSAVAPDAGAASRSNGGYSLGGRSETSVQSRGGYGSMMEADSAVAPDAGAASRSNGGYSLGGRSETSVQSRGGYGSMMEADSAVAPDASAASRSNGGYSLGGRSETSVQSRGGYGSMMEADSAVAPDAGAASRSNGGYSLGGRSETSVQSRGGYGSMMEADSAVAPDAGAASRSNGGYSLGGRSETSVQSRGGYGSMMEADSAVAPDAGAASRSNGGYSLGGRSETSVQSRGGYGSMMEADSAVAPDAGAASRSNGGYSLGGRSETSVQSRGGYGSMMEADSAVAPDAGAASRSNGGYSLGGRSETSVQSRGGYGSMMEADSAVAPDAGAASRSNGGYSLGGRSETSVQSRGGYGSMMEADSAVAPDAGAASRSNGGYSLGGRSETSVQSRGGYGSMMEADSAVAPDASAASRSNGGYSLADGGCCSYPAGTSALSASDKRAVKAGESGDSTMNCSNEQVGGRLANRGFADCAPAGSESISWYATDATVDHNPLADALQRLSERHVSCLKDNNACTFGELGCQCATGKCQVCTTEATRPPPRQPQPVPPSDEVARAQRFDRFAMRSSSTEKAPGCGSPAPPPPAAAPAEEKSLNTAVPLQSRQRKSRISSARVSSRSNATLVRVGAGFNLRTSPSPARCAEEASTRQATQQVSTISEFDAVTAFPAKSTPPGRCTDSDANRTGSFLEGDGLRSQVTILTYPRSSADLSVHNMPDAASERADASIQQLREHQRSGFDFSGYCRADCLMMTPVSILQSSPGNSRIHDSKTVEFSTRPQAAATAPSGVSIPTDRTVCGALTAGDSAVTSSVVPLPLPPEATVVNPTVCALSDELLRMPHDMTTVLLGGARQFGRFSTMQAAHEEASGADDAEEVHKAEFTREVHTKHRNLATLLCHSRLDESGVADVHSHVLESSAAVTKTGLANADRSRSVGVLPREQTEMDAAGVDEARVDSSDESRETATPADSDADENWISSDPSTTQNTQLAVSVPGRRFAHRPPMHPYNYVRADHDSPEQREQRQRRRTILDVPGVPYVDSPDISTHIDKKEAQKEKDRQLFAMRWAERGLMWQQQENEAQRYEECQVHFGAGKERPRGPRVMIMKPGQQGAVALPGPRLPNWQPTTSPVAPLREGQQRPPRANAKAPLGPHSATASTPKAADNEGGVGSYPMLRRLTADLAHTLDNCVAYGTLYDNSGPEVHEGCPLPHPSAPPYSLLQCRTLAVPQPSPAPKGAGEPARDTVPRRNTDGNSVNNNAFVHEPEGEKNFHEAMLHLSRLMSGTRDKTTGTMSDGASGTAIRGGRANNSGRIRTLRSSRRASDATSGPANSSSAKNRDSSEASGFSRVDFASLFMTPSYDLRCDEPTGMYNCTFLDQPLGQSAGVFSLAGTTSGFSTPPVSMTSRQTSKRKQNEESGSNARLGRHVEDTAAEASESVAMHLTKMEENMEESMCSQTAGTAMLRRVNGLALSQWKYVALVANKVMEKKTLVRASRALSQRVLSVSGALELNVLPHDRLREASAGGAKRNDSLIFDATTESRYVFDTDDDEVSVYDADGRPLLIPNMSDLWDDFRSSNSSDESLVFGEADAFTVDDAQQRTRRQAPQNGSANDSWGGRGYEYSNGDTNLYPAARGCPSSSAKMPWPQPDIYNGPKVYTGQSKFVDFTALSGIRLSDVKRVKSPCWYSIKLADAKRRQETDDRKS
ncbi:hypothetical protein CGC21_11135 [Leishmania donovani]|uniref:Uncharacterized protein n=1 Tax=Leishmania donovani TaxID=5661 RepID=A0A504X0Y2_LEIDO|nr:hypothetical protein CGC21_11135 [Leishmania donovani]